MLLSGFTVGSNESLAESLCRQRLPQAAGVSPSAPRQMEIAPAAEIPSRGHFDRPDSESVVFAFAFLAAVADRTTTGPISAFDRYVRPTTIAVEVSG
jgi:hypothetical protein